MTRERTSTWSGPSQPRKERRGGIACIAPNYKNATKRAPRNRHLPKFAPLVIRPYRQSMNPKIICLLAALNLTLGGALFAAGGETDEITRTGVSASGTPPSAQNGRHNEQVATATGTIQR